MTGASGKMWPSYATFASVGGGSYSFGLLSRQLTGKVGRPCEVTLIALSPSPCNSLCWRRERRVWPSCTLRTTSVDYYVFLVYMYYTQPTTRPILLVQMSRIILEFYG